MEATILTTVTMAILIMDITDTHTMDIILMVDTMTIITTEDTMTAIIV